MRVASEASVEPRRLPARIAVIERRILDRRASVRRDAATLEFAMRDRMTSLPMLLAAGGLGFLLGVLASRKGAAVGPWAEKVVGGALRVALVRASLAALRHA